MSHCAGYVTLTYSSMEKRKGTANHVAGGEKQPWERGTRRPVGQETLRDQTIDDDGD